MPHKILSEFETKDMTVLYVTDENSAHVGLIIVPTCMKGEIAAFGGTASSPIDSIVQLKLVGSPYPGGFAQGRTMRAGPDMADLKYRNQEIASNRNLMIVKTFLTLGDICTMEHRLAWRTDEDYVRISTILSNTSQKVIELEMLSSFSLGGITPFTEDDAPDRLKSYRIRSSWCAEGRLEKRSLEELHLERNYGHAVLSERFGQVGSMPVRGFFPFVAVEDDAKEVVWGAQLEHNGSWQMEVFRRHDKIAISGGLADREFGHWTKVLKPGESFKTPASMVSCVKGDVDSLCQRLVSAQKRMLDRQPEVEKNLPVIFNEWCTSWGRPTRQSLVAISEKLKDSGVKYLVIDAGWYVSGVGNWANMQGDWVPSADSFPGGLKATADEIRKRGLIPGLWFEFEVAGSLSKAFNLKRHFLARDGVYVCAGDRRFWDFRDPYVIDYLSDRVIKLLKECGFGYLKVDYNETIGIGVDGACSLGEGLRQHLEGVKEFFRKIRKEIPDIVIENCASGGHRLEPSMMALADMGSFSDAHESLELPLIAANMHRMILPCQSQIWCVLRKSDEVKRICYSLSATCLGRMCLSGDILELSEQQRSYVDKGIEFYGMAAPVIRDGFSRRFGPELTSWRHPKGWQAILRVSHDGARALLVFHSFTKPFPDKIEIPLPEGRWEIEKALAHSENLFRMENSKMIFNPEEFSGAAFLVKKNA